MTTDQTIDVSPPGELILEELDARGWSQQELAEIMGTNAALVSEIVNAKRAITPETALLLAQAFGTSAEVWLRLDARYRLSSTKPKKAADVELRARLFAKAPIKEMVKRGWIEGAKKPEMIEQQVLAFFECKSLDEDFVFKHAARKSRNYGETTPAQCAWLHRARQMARLIKVGAAWKASNAADLVQELQRLTLSAPAVQDVPRVLNSFGVRFVVVAPLPQAKMDGATFWLGDTEPVIAVTVRYDRIDNFWHTVMHELKHVIKGETSLDVDVLSRESKPENERRADQFAVESLVPQPELDDFSMRVAPLYSEVRILGFAARIRVHPGIVVGQLHHRGVERRGLDYTHFRKLLVPVRSMVTSTAFTDGWGGVVPSLTQ